MNTTTLHTRGIDGISGVEIHRLICPWIAGSVAGATSCILVFFIDTLRRRMQLSASKRTALSVVREIAKGGPGRVYRGLSLDLFKAVPSSAVQFWVFEQLKQAWGLGEVVKISAPPLSKERRH
jgi:hypothetical protein